jgi:hypothetical protein
VGALLKVDVKEHVARKREMRNGYKIFVGKPEWENHLEYLGLDGKVILEWILGK